MVKSKWVARYGILLLLAGCSSMNTYEWTASESGDKNHLMQVVSGDFLFPKGGSLYIPNGKSLNSGWGSGLSMHVTGERYKPLPDKVDLLYFSYTEDKFYQGHFDLPYERISNLFEQGFYSPHEDKHVTYTGLTAGMAPGGIVTVWVQSPDKIKEVFFGKIDESTQPWNKITENTNITREQYIQNRLKESLTPEAIQNIKENGIPFDKWANYRNRYRWKPQVVADNPPTLLSRINYFNGERDFLHYPLEPVLVDAERPIPKSIYMLWMDKDRKIHQKLTATFNETEIFAAFEKLIATEAYQQRPLELELHIQKHPEGLRYAIQLHNNEEAIVLKKTKFKEW